VIFRNFVDGSFRGKVFAVNPNADEVLNRKCYPSILSISEKIDLAIVSVPASLVLKAVTECSKKGVKDVIIVTSGFKEAGNYTLDRKLEGLLRKCRMRCVGPNCLGIFNATTGMDSIFLPRSRLKRPKEGRIGFICQSGAIGSSILDLGAEEGYGFSKFVSYGNAMIVDETDLLGYLGADEKTKVICLYIEGVKNGKNFLRVASEISKRKPIIAIKGGMTDEGSKAAMSHTGSLAGSAEIYLGVFKQAGIIHATTLEEMFHFAEILSKCIRPKGNRVQVITNGGGYGILAADAIANSGLKLADMDEKTKKRLKPSMPPLISISNPMDLLGDATTERYKIAINACLDDKNIDVILVIALYQTPLLTTDVVDVIIETSDMKIKPIIVVSAGGEFTKVLKKSLDENDIPTYTFPEQAVLAIAKMVEYYGKK
jgi:acetyl coenzyme A synthetase (ADP forming)-like protein